MGVAAIHDVPEAFVAAQMESVYSDLNVAATKIGMLSQAPIIQTVAAGLARHGAQKIVLDPVMVTTSGHLLLSKNAVESLKRDLLPVADIITPNLHEAAVLLGADVAVSRSEMEHQAKRLLALGARAVLLKGGHFDEPTADDLYLGSDDERWFSAPRIPTRNTHGTGCTLSSAIAAGLARGNSIKTSIETAKHYLTQAIAHADDLSIGQGPGPVHHFYATWNS